MQNAMYSALFGALSNEFRLNNIANNLANVNTTGYKRDVLAFKDTFALYAHDYIREPVTNIRAEHLLPESNLLSRTRIALAKTDYEQGALKATGGPLDAAISGEGFFKIETPQGEMYTRNGNFRLTADGNLINGFGYPVLGAGGPITIPQGSSMSIAEDGSIIVDNVAVEQLAFVSLEDLSVLEKQGGNLFKLREGEEAAEIAAPGFVVNGFLEAANVDAVYEMVNMIEAQRQFEAYAKVMQTSDAVDKETIQRIGRAR